MKGIIVHSGEWDRIYHAFNIASVYASFDEEVVVFLTYWAVDTIVSDTQMDGRKGEILSSAIQKGILKRLEDVIKMAKSVGNVKVSVCVTTLNMLGIDEKELPNWVDEVGGLAEVLSAETVIFI